MQCHQGYTAKAVIKGSETNPTLQGEVVFYQEKNAVLVQALILHLPQNSSGFYGFHIHEGSQCDEDFQNTGGHLNLNHQDHPSHTGDLPPLLFCNGNAYMTVRTDRFRVREIIGRTVIIHSRADDFRSQPSGDAGEKIACGIILAV